MSYGGNDQPKKKFAHLFGRSIVALMVSSVVWISSTAQTAPEKSNREASNVHKPKPNMAAKATKITGSPTAAPVASTKPITPRIETPSPPPSETASEASENAASTVATKEEKLPFKLNDRKEVNIPPPSPLGLIVRTIGALLLIVGLVFGAAWLLRRFDLLPFNNTKDESNGLKVVSTVRLGERRALSVVKFGEKMLLIGSSPEGLTLLSEQEDEIAVPTPQPNNPRTVTDLLARGTEQNFEREFAHATTSTPLWSGRRN